MDFLKEALSILKYEGIEEYKSSLLKRDLKTCTYKKDYILFKKNKTKIIISQECAKQIVYRNKLKFLVYRLEDYKDFFQGKKFSEILLNHCKNLQQVYKNLKDDNNVDKILEDTVNMIESHAIIGVEPSHSVFVIGPNIVYRGLKQPSQQTITKLKQDILYLENLLNTNEQQL